METEKTCSNCNRQLEIGTDVIRADEGVIGMKGFIPLENVLFFCCERCLKEYFNGDLPNLPGRIP